MNVILFSNLIINFSIQTSLQKFTKARKHHLLSIAHHEN